MMTETKQKMPPKILPKFPKTHRKKNYLILKQNELFFLRNFYKKVD